ncbi:hypothetical protein L6452_46506 [Arctium lappa]|nr:hypothetical protein L6452_46506 [Arctium lappa]
MGAGDASRSDVERREPVRQSTRGVDRCGLVRRPKPGAVDMPVEMPSRRSWLAARAVTACLGTCVLPAPACGHPIRPVLKHGPRSLTCDSWSPGASSIGVKRMIRGIGGATPSTYSQTLNSLPTLESTQSEVGSSGWKSTARRAVSGAPPAALENPEDRVPPTPGRTHNRISALNVKVKKFNQARETTAKGTGLAESAGKEDPVELDSSPTL